MPGLRKQRLALEQSEFLFAGDEIVVVFLRQIRVIQADLDYSGLLINPFVS